MPVLIHQTANVLTEHTVWLVLHCPLCSMNNYNLAVNVQKNCRLLWCNHSSLPLSKKRLLPQISSQDTDEFKPTWRIYVSHIPAFVRCFAIKTDPFIHTRTIIPYCVLFDLILSLSVFSFKNWGVKTHPTALSTQIVVILWRGIFQLLWGSSAATANIQI